MNIYFKLSIFIILSQLALMFQKLENENFLYVLGITVVVLFVKFKNISIRALFRHPSLIILMGIQFVFEDYTITKDFFINCLYILLLFKFLETQKKDYFFFVALSIFVTIANLINNQNLLSSLISGASAIATILLLYLINQRELISLNIQNLKRIVLISVFTVPIIILTYLFFPRAEVKVSLFANKSNNLGIPDKISLGSFQQITLEDKDIFNAKFFNNANQNELYFRVKTFEMLDQLKNWRSIDTKVTFRRKSNITQKINPSIKYDLILFNHGKKWVPVLDYAVPKENDFNYNPYNFSYNMPQKMSSKKKFIFSAQNTPLNKDISIKERSYYLQIPNTVNDKLIKWAKKNKINKSDTEYSKFLLNYFRNENFFYNLKPEPIGNNYSKFFFETKEGYCEYYAGTMTLLLRAAGIPSRIVTGFYGGRYNNLGDFYTFSQEDAHSWVEAWIDNVGWIRFDPTQVIPPQRVKNTINSFSREENDIEIEQNELQKFFGEKGLNLWIRYLDYQWTNYLINYNQIEQKKLLSKLSELDKETYLNLFKNIISLVTLILVILLLNLLLDKKKYSSYIFYLLVKKYKLNDKPFQIHQKIFQNIENKNYINDYEKILFNNKNISTFKFLSICFKIIKA